MFFFFPTCVIYLHFMELAYIRLAEASCSAFVLVYFNIYLTSFLVYLFSIDVLRCCHTDVKKLNYQVFK